MLQTHKQKQMLNYLWRGFQTESPQISIKNTHITFCSCFLRNKINYYLPIQSCITQCRLQQHKSYKNIISINTFMTYNLKSKTSWSADDERGSLTAWVKYCSVVWWYGSKYFFISCQTTAGLTGLGNLSGY